MNDRARYIPCREIEYRTSDIPDEAVRMSRITQGIERAFDEIRKHVPEVRRAIFTVYLNQARAVRGYYWQDSWRRVSKDGETRTWDEIHISSHLLAEGTTSVLRTLLHEAVHSLAVARKIQDTSRQNRYHNEKFKNLAVELGLQVHKPKKGEDLWQYGWQTPGIEPDEITVGRWRKALVILDDAVLAAQDLPWMIQLGGAGRHAPKRRTIKRTGLLKLTCGCGHIIRASTKVRDLAIVGCEDCGELFDER